MVSQPPDERGNALTEAASWLLSAAGGSLPITSLNKALFYLDLASMLESGKPVTNATYIALPAGPVVAKYDKRVVRALEDAGVAQQDEDEDGVTKPVCLVCQPEHKLLTDLQLQLAERIGRWAQRKTARFLSDYSHENTGWKLAWEQGLGRKLPAQKINLRIAMQQVADDDPWLKEEPDADERAAFAAADAEAGIDW